MKMTYPRVTTMLLCATLLVPLSCEDMESAAFADEDVSEEAPGDDAKVDVAASETSARNILANDASKANRQIETLEDKPLVLAEIQLSETHRITLSLESDNSYSIDEKFHVDLDRDHIADSFSALDTSNMTYTEVYDRIAGKTWNTKTRRIFEAAELDLMEREYVHQYLDLRQMPMDTIQNEMVDPSDLDDVIKRPQDEQMAVRAGCSSTPSGFDWEADDGWFKNNMCKNDSNACYTSGIAPHWIWASYGYYTTRKMKAFGYAQSFCNKARFYFMKKTWNWLGHKSVKKVRDEILEPRWYWGHENTNSGDTAYFTRTEYYSGSDTKRIAMSIHHN